ncbi:hypothetical protein [Desulfurispira natronophila]|uniref:Stringent starvation protein B n=1 Tax=Desulfurispira natronophila TaxID=682562 RepID=A0A7W7Y4F7_9BACT|nr:hypothetical protein [Desulfurispira natronophila]MBB5021913.1 stringent starvation protein B [Desulfurispira natronophila]
MQKFDIFEAFIQYYGSAYLVVNRNQGECYGIKENYFKDNQVVLVFNPLSQPPWSYEDDTLHCILSFDGERCDVAIEQNAVAATYCVHEGHIQAQAVFPPDLDEIVFGTPPKESKRLEPTDDKKILKLF